ncbi:hypothetical protein [Candidatus Odyssella acanthamoebae]|uniref:Nudix hydrolase domain-containing protein n=1 Tax=Candidatus Odyssella acanthamoebae TaxID=91604 RepID=A0A077AT19_9PROT|nr:hypothetical protein [Candidatus Paracaedibacter acanthamoebae]AIK96352.1 hypothetical protein ID47_05800 [Candidatus Paracaedibacter acanthamoebae]
MARFYKYISITLTATFLCNSIVPSFGMEPWFSPASLDALSQEGRTAAGILHYALRDKEIYILLGQRDDSLNSYGDWCNFGGGSEEGRDESLLDSSKDSQLSFLWQDAARESREESNGIYAPHPRLLRHQPFIDVLTEKENDPFLYRMYWQQVQYIAPEIFKEKLESSSEEHNKEYTDFIWVKASQLLTAIQAENPLLQVDETLINIYGPLFETLSTPAGRQFLKHLTALKTLKTLIKKPASKDEKYEYFSVRPYFNRIYHIGGTGTVDQFYPALIPHPMVVASQNPLKDIKKRMIENRVADSQSSSPDHLPPNTYELIELNAAHEDTLAHAVSAHGMAMMEIKRRFSQEFTSSEEKDVPLWDMNCPESISRIHLRIILGKDYKTSADFIGDENSVRKADLANIREYFSRYTSTEYEQKNHEKNEFKRKIHLLESDYEFFADVLAFEEENKNWPTFYHGASQDINNLLKSLTYLRELISLKSFEGLMALRGSDIYFKGTKTVQELLELEGDCESPVTKAAMLFLNFTLFAGPHTTSSTSSSAEYLVNDHSVDAPDIKGIFLESLSLIGFSQPVYDYFHSLFEQYYRYQGLPWANSVLLAITQHPEDIDTYNYASRGNGFFNEIPSTLNVLNNIQAEYYRLQMEQQKTGILEGFEKERERKKNLFPENRLWLHPSRVMNPSHVKIKAFDRFRLAPESQDSYDQAMRQTTAVLLGEWLTHKAIVLEGSFIYYPSLKKLHHLVVKGVTGKALQEEFSSKGLIYLIHNGHLTAVKQYLENYPEVLQEESFNPHTVIPAVLKTNDLEFINYFVKEIFNLDLSNFFTQDELLFQIAYCVESDYYHALLYLFKNCDFSKVEDSIKLSWAKLLDLNDSKAVPLLEEYLHRFYKIAPPLMKDFLNIIWDNLSSQESIKIILDSPFAQPQLLLNGMGTLAYNKNLTGKTFQTSDKLISLLKKGADLSLPHPLTDEPIVFLFKNCDLYMEPQDYSLIANLLDVKNKQGLTFLREIQKNYMENGNVSNFVTPLKTELEKANRNYADDSYPPFIKYFGNLSHVSINLREFGSIFLIPDYKIWVDALQNVKNVFELQNVINSCPDSEIYDLFMNKIAALKDKLTVSEDLDYTAIDNLRRSEREWEGQVRNCMQECSPNLSILAEHIKQAPSRTVLRNAFGAIIKAGEQFIDLLPNLLEKLYPEKESFIAEDSISNFISSCLNQHPIFHASTVQSSYLLTQTLVNFLGIENLPLIKGRIELDDLIEFLSEDQLEKLYESSPNYFTAQTPHNNFVDCLLSLPADLKRKVVFSDLDKLKMRGEDLIPPFWRLFSSDSNFSLVKELVELDPSLLHLKGLNGVDVAFPLQFFPKNSITKFVSNRLALEN